MIAKSSMNRPVSTDRSNGRPSATAPLNPRLSFWAALFLTSLVIPLFVYVGPLRLSTYRVILLLSLLPATFLLLSGKAGRIRLPDICVFLICIWSSLSLAVVHGLSSMIETVGILWIETLGAYLVGRCFIRTPAHFLAMARIIFRIGVVIAPFAAYELLTGVNLVLEIFGIFGKVYGQVPSDPRWGLHRVQGPFAHQIHFGVFFATSISMTYLVVGHGHSWFGRAKRTALSVFLCFSALSSGPLSAATAQIYLLVWNGALKNVKWRWYLLSALAILAYITIDFISNRTPFHVFISYFAFSEHTAYNRILIWVYGTQNIWANPVFGIGHNDWARPWWMVASADMFWILPAMRHGVVVWLLWLSLFFFLFLKIAARPKFKERMQWYRLGYLCSLSGLFLAGWTVHYWDALYAFFMFFLGSGVWMIGWDDGDDNSSTPPPINGSTPRNQTLGYTRFHNSKRLP